MHVARSKCSSAWRRPVCQLGAQPGIRERGQRVGKRDGVARGRRGRCRRRARWSRGPRRRRRQRGRRRPSPRERRWAARRGPRCCRPPTARPRRRPRRTRRGAPRATCARRARPMSPRPWRSMDSSSDACPTPVPTTRSSADLQPGDRVQGRETFFSTNRPTARIRSRPSPAGRRSESAEIDPMGEEEHPCTGHRRRAARRRCCRPPRRRRLWRRASLGGRDLPGVQRVHAELKPTPRLASRGRRPRWAGGRSTRGRRPRRRYRGRRRARSPAARVARGQHAHQGRAPRRPAEGCARRPPSWRRRGPACRPVPAPRGSRGRTSPTCAGSRS